MKCVILKKNKTLQWPLLHNVHRLFVKVHACYHLSAIMIFHSVTTVEFHEVEVLGTRFYFELSVAMGWYITQQK